MIRRRFAAALLLTASLALAQDEPPATPPVQKLMRYTVVKGDSCLGLAQRIYGDSRRVDLIHQFNDLGPQPHNLTPGLVLYLPPPNLAPPLSGPDARLTSVHNRVEVQNPTLKRAQTNEPLSRGHQVKTYEGSGAEVLFRDETRLQLGENTLVVIFGDSSKKASQKATVSDTQLMSGQLRAHLGALAGSETTVQTAAGEVTLGSGEAQIKVDDKKTTRLMVYSGQSAITSKNQTVKVSAGFGSRATEGDAPSPPRPLPPAPVWISTPPPSFLTSGRRVTLEAEYGPGKGSGPAPVQWHIQVARDKLFNTLVVNARVPVGTTKIEARRLGPGRYYARVSALDDEFEGPFSSVVQTLVAVARLVRDESKNSVIAQISPGDIFCGLDGGPLGPLSQTLRKTKKIPSKIRCGPSSNPKLATSLDLPPPSIAPFVLLPRLERPDPLKREALLVWRLQDAKQQPVSGSSIDLSLSAGVLSGPVEEGDDDGEYQAPIWWSEEAKTVTPKIRVDGTLELEADPLELPMPPPPPPPPPEPEPPPPPPPPLPPPRSACGCAIPGAPRFPPPWGGLAVAAVLLRRRRPSRRSSHPS
ncbi:MAG: FecR domain-containing protein, partial [Myxococcales bacterium]|nr:FecR family protein [Polyangiaceae bacterium]MDW8251616.1 FecR domain-containing protein [Myxococcales bacterium]